MKKVNISQKQARDFANCIYPDIRDYIKSHQAEYEAFLKAEGLCQQKGGEN